MVAENIAVARASPHLLRKSQNPATDPGPDDPRAPAGGSVADGSRLQQRDPRAGVFAREVQRGRRSGQAGTHHGDIDIEPALQGRCRRPTGRLALPR
jgi:hypothetical protein